MPIGACDHQPQRHPVSLGQQAALDAPFGAVGRIGPGFFPPQAALSSSPHPYSTNSSPAPSGHQTAPPQLSTTSGILRLSPILGTDHAPWNGDTNRSSPRPPTDTRYGVRRKSHRHTVDPGSGVSLRQSDAGCGASAAAAQAPPTIRRIPEILRLLCSPRPAAVSSLLVSC